MGQVNSGTRLAAFQTQTYPSGLDLHRCVLNGRNLGTWKANTAGTFRAGQAVTLNSSGEIIAFDAAAGSELIGIAKWSKVTLGRALVIDEPVTFGTADATKTLAHSSLVSGTTVVRSAVEGGGTTYTVTTDYTINTTNGTVTHVDSGGSIDESEPVYVSYSWSLTEADYQFEGKNFWQSNDYVTQQGGFVTVIEAPSIIYTTEFDADQVYALTGATSNIYANSAGVFTSLSTSAQLCGKVLKVPSNDDPFLGFKFFGQIDANS